MQMFDHNTDPTKDIAFPFFYEDSQEDPRATQANGGVPVFKPLIKVRIKIPGSRDEVDRPVEEHDKKRWPTIWAQFEKGQKQQLDGIPLAEFATATAAERATLAQMGCQTVEQVAGLRDDTAARLNLFGVKRKADAFMKVRQELGNVGKLMATIESLEKRIKELESGNTNPVVSASDAGDGVQPAEHIPDEPKPRRKAAGSASQ